MGRLKKLSFYITESIAIFGDMCLRARIRDRYFLNLKALKSFRIRAIYREVAAKSGIPSKYSVSLLQFSRGLNGAIPCVFLHEERCVILIPVAAFAYSDQALRGILAHELAHLTLGHFDELQMFLTFQEVQQREREADYRASQVAGQDAMATALHTVLDDLGPRVTPDAKKEVESRLALIESGTAPPPRPSPVE